jgi:hypothetical protein
LTRDLVSLHFFMLCNFMPRQAMNISARNAAVNAVLHIKRDNTAVTVNPWIWAGEGQNFEVRLLALQSGPSGVSALRQSQRIRIQGLQPYCGSEIRSGLRLGDKVDYELELWQNGAMVFSRKESIHA